MDFLRTPDPTRSFPDITPGGTLAVPWSSAIGRGGTPAYGSRQDIKESFRALFSPGGGPASPPAPSPDLAARYASYPSITPYIAPSPQLDEHQQLARENTPRVDGPPAAAKDRTLLMTSPYLRQAAKDAVAREFMNMPTYVAGGRAESPPAAASSGESSASAEQTVPGARQGPKNASVAHGVPLSDDARKRNNREDKQGVDGRRSAANTAGNMPRVAPQMMPVYPIGVRGFVPPPPGLHAMHPVPMGMPMPMMMHAPEGGQMMGGFMASVPVVQKERVKADETPEERKLRIEREKEDLVREFKKKTREAALVRFRQKRRERKFGKLIRYDCRKKLADARPRVKGRFVRVKDLPKQQRVEENHSDDTQVVPGV